MLENQREEKDECWSWNIWVKKGPSFFCVMKKKIRRETFVVFLWIYTIQTLDSTSNVGQILIPAQMIIFYPILIVQNITIWA